VGLNLGEHQDGLESCLQWKNCESRDGIRKLGN